MHVNLKANAYTSFVNVPINNVVSGKRNVKKRNEKANNRIIMFGIVE